MSRRVPWYARWIVGASAYLVPQHRRAGWRLQWVAELEHRHTDRHSRSGIARFAFGAIWHALYLRREDMILRGCWSDLRHSVRSLVRTRGFTALTVATLALGIGTATGVFSIVETMLLRPVPLDEGERLVRIFSSNARSGFGRFSVSYPDYVDFTNRSDIFESASFYASGTRDLSGEGEPERVRTARVHERYFEVLRSEFMLGRAFTVDDHRVATPASVVLSEPFWVRRFGSDSTVVGRSIRLDGVPHTVIGVVRSGQGWPTGTHAWIPLQWGSAVPDYASIRSNHTWQVVARLQGDISVRAASEQVREMARTIYSAPEIDRRDVATEAVVVGLGASDAGDETAGILGVMGVAVFLVLLIACLNASGLLLARAWGRAAELSLRAALGAGRIRLAAILLVESLVLALAGGAVGVALAVAGLRRMVATLPNNGADLTGVELNPTVAAGALAISVVAAVMAGVVPALRASRTSVSEALKEGGAQSSLGRGGSRLRRGLVIAELSLSLALLVSAGITVQGFQRQIRTDPGFDQTDVLTFTVRLPASRYGETSLVDAYYRDAIDALERHPAVLAATSTSRLPLGAGGMGLIRSFVFDGAPAPPDGPEYPASWVEIDPDYFETLGIRPMEGRAFTTEDDGAAPMVAIVTRQMAARMSPEESIVGRQIRSPYDENLARTVVGVIGDLQFDGLSGHQKEAVVLVPRAQAVRTSMAFMVRAESDPTPFLGEIRAIMAGLDADVALDALQTLREAHDADLAGVRLLTVIFTVFGVGALLLAVSGVYGLVSFSVSQRTHEIGIRMAMGASAAGVRRAVIREGLTLAGIGLAIGVVVAYGFSRLLAAALFGLAEIDPVTFATVALVLGAAVVVASWFPAVRATRVDPTEALRGG